jgi:hypothetical protein
MRGRGARRPAINDLAAPREGTVRANRAELAGIRLDCYGGSAHRSWEYASLSDFIAEAELPNLVLVRQRTWSGGGPMLISYSSHTTVNTFEAFATTVGTASAVRRPARSRTATRPRP